MNKPKKVKETFEEVARTSERDWRRCFIAFQYRFPRNSGVKDGDRILVTVEPMRREKKRD